MLSVSGLNIFHGNLQVVWDLSFSVKPGEIVTLIGPNGAGKTTTVEAVAGLNPNVIGNVEFNGERILGLPPHEIFRRGLALVPEKRELFPKMTVLENLVLGAGGRKAEEKIRHVCSLFPVLGERELQLAGTLSGGEQQMLAIARSLMSEPGLLILDEPSTGLSPQMVAQVFRALERLGNEGMTVLLLEQNVRNALELCHRGYVLENGRIVREGSAKELLYDPEIQKSYLGI